MQPFVDSSTLLGAPEALRERAARDGYLFFRGLLSDAAAREVRREILEVCARRGFLRPGSPLDDAVAADGVRLREGDPEYMAAYDEIQRLEAFHALAHQPPLLRALRELFGEEVLVHPRNIARVMFPQNNLFTTPAHQDYVHIQGTEETWTAWIPLGDCPRELGGLEVLPGSHRFGVLPVRSAYGAGGLGVETEGLGLEWAGGDFRCGDVLFFRSLLVHRGVNNGTEDRVRLSVDYRYQPLSHPVTESSLLPHFNRVPWEEIYRGWQSAELQYYWKRHPLHLAEFTRKYHASAGR
jgi:ectoine hydroxylase-related dioxygenase (phytanoyl-CoA dioxygenase family)